MPIAFVNRAVGFEDASDTSTPTAAQSHTAGNLLAVGVKYEGTATGITINDTAGNTYNPLTRFDLPGGGASDMHVQMFYAKNIIGNGSNVLTVTFDAARTFKRVCALQYSGCDQDDPFDQEAGGTGTGTATLTSGNITTTFDDEVLVAFGGEFDIQAGYTPGANYTERWDGPVDSGSNDSAMEDRIVDAIGTYNATMTQTNTNDWVIAIASFKAASEEVEDIEASLLSQTISHRPRPMIPSGSFKRGLSHVLLQRKQPVGRHPAGYLHLLQNPPCPYRGHRYPDLRRGLRAVGRY